MAQQLIHDIDDEDRSAALEAQARMGIKASLGSEIITQQLIEHGISPNTPVPDKIAILKELNGITAATERAKRQVANELGGPSEGNGGPRITLIIGDKTETGTRARLDVRKEEEGDDFIDGEWGLIAEEGGVV